MKLPSLSGRGWGWVACSWYGAASRWREPYRQASTHLNPSLTGRGSMIDQAKTCVIHSAIIAGLSLPSISTVVSVVY